MERDGDDDAGWTGERVEARLIAAFRALPGHPVFSGAGAVSVSGDREAGETLTWARQFVVDRQDRLALLTWARCRATGDSCRSRYKALGWSRASAERARQRAVQVILAGLNA